MLPGVPLHEVVAPVPVHAAPDALAGLQVVPGDRVHYRVPFLVDLGHPVPADRAGVAHLPAPSGVERRAVQNDLVALDGDHVGLELEAVAVASEYLVCHEAPQSRGEP